MQSKFLSVLISLFLIGSSVQAATVSVQSAQTVAINYYKTVAPGLSARTTLSAQLKYMKTETDGTVDFYVFDILPATGFVIVSATDAVIPVIAYSTESHFVTGYQQTGLINWEHKVSGQIHAAVTQQLAADARISGLWTAYNQGQNPASLRSGSVSPLCSTLWDQAPYYNGDCPIVPSNDSQSVTGCVATAMAQIMKFWNYPATGTGSYSYTDNKANGNSYNIGTVSANFGGTSYTWSQMPKEISGANAQIATIMFQAGVSVRMDYGNWESGAYVLQDEANKVYGYQGAPCSQYAYINYFNYDPNTISGVHEQDYSSGDWLSLIENELNAGRPVQYEGADPQQGGHTWVCDGYDANNNFHMNWGWSGYDDGYYAVNNLNPDIYDFSEQDGALIGIEPIMTVPVAALSANTSTSCTGIIQFTDNSTGNPSSWLWNFGDGTSSALQNPQHTYLRNGTYNVTLQVTNTYGSNQATISPGITVSRLSAPVVTGGTHCSASTFSLSASTSNPVTWIDSSGNAVSHTNPFVTATLSSTTTYWAYDSVVSTAYSAGPANDNFNTGSTLNVPHNLVFNVMKAGTLVSVEVYASGAGSRTFVMTDGSGNVLSSAVVNVPDGGSTVALNFDLPVGGPYYIGPAGNNINLYRNNAGAAYPYNDADGIVSITGNDAGSAPYYYYYCYNWQVKEHDCVSLPAPATATVSGITSLSPAITAVACNGGANGSVSLNVKGGTPSYAYTWSNGQTASSILNVAAGTYGVTVKDAAGCSITASENVTQPAAPLKLNVIASNITCNGAKNGSIIVGVSGGTSNYTYNWGNSTSSSISGLSTGSYTVTVTDAHSCTATSTSTITQPAAINIQLTTTNTGCGSTSTGSITSNVTGGTSGYTYLWSSNSTTSSISNLAANTYSITVTDTKGCTSAESSTVTNSGNVSLSAASTEATCYNSNTGSASVSVSGATAPLTYLWSNGATTSSISQVGAGTYDVTVTDVHGCSATASPVVAQPLQLLIRMNAVNSDCGKSNGLIIAEPTGGTGNYTYLWNTQSTGQAISNLSTGNYSVTVTDTHSCTSSSAVDILNASNLVSSLSQNNLSCFNASTGSASVDVEYGSSPFTYLWNNGSTTTSISGLTAGSYSVTITDSLGCSAVDTLTLTQPSQLAVSVTVNQPACPGVIHGTATASASGGTPSYTILWSNNGVGENSSPLSAGNYSVSVHDLNSCLATSAFSIDTVPNINPNAVITADSCYGDATGRVQLAPTGGTSPFRYSWSDGQTSSILQGVAAGKYNVTITDNHSCLYSTQVVVTQPEPLKISTTSTPATNGQNNGEASVENVSGGTAPYNLYSWSDGQTTQAAANLAAGAYTVTVTDNNGCAQSAAVTVSSVTGVRELANNSSFKVYPNPAQSEAVVYLNNIDEGAIIIVRNILGQQLYTTPVTFMQTKLNVSNYANGVYTVQLIQGDNRSVAQFVVSR